MPQSPSTGSTLILAETGPGKHGANTIIPGAGVENPATTSPGPGTGTTAVGNGREDLTVFFSIGVVIDVLLVTAFLVWAVGQWRKTKK